MLHQKQTQARRAHLANNGAVPTMQGDMAVKGQAPGENGHSMKPNKHGGAGRGQGRKSGDGAVGLERKMITIDPNRAEVLRAVGDGWLSLGVRRAADMIAGQRSKRKKATV